MDDRASAKDSPKGSRSLPCLPGADSTRIGALGPIDGNDRTEMSREQQLPLDFSVKFPETPREEVVLSEWIDWNANNDAEELKLLRRMK